jgi:hypothetical protein
MWKNPHKSNAMSPIPFAIALLVLRASLARAGEDRFDVPNDFVPRTPLQADSLRIVINVPAFRLYLVSRNELVKEYPVAVGRPWTPTPRGSFRILQKTKDPTWAPKGRKPVPPGPANPLGHRWMRISADGYGIHATNDPGSIGQARSHGCIRMFRADAEDLFDRVALDTPVEIVYELEGYANQSPTRWADVYGLAAKVTVGSGARSDIPSGSGAL